MRIRTPVICAIVIGLLAGSSGAVSAQESDATAREVPAGIESPGPLGRPYADWARDYFVWRAEKPKANGCRVVEDGAVVFVAPAWDAADVEFGSRVFEPFRDDGGDGQVNEIRWETDCEVTSEQHILLAIPSRACDPIDATLDKKWERAYYGGDWERAGKIDKRRRNQQGGAFGCVLAAHDEIAQPFRFVDGERSAIDERFFTIATPAVIDNQMLVGAGYFVMLAPLPVGNHRVVWGAFKVGSDVISERAIVNVHVKETAAE